MWDKVFKNGPRKICGRQPLKSLKGYGLHKHVFACDLQIRMQTLSSVCKIDRPD